MRVLVMISDVIASAVLLVATGGMVLLSVLVMTPAGTLCTLAPVRVLATAHARNNNTSNYTCMSDWCVVAAVGHVRL